MPRASIVVDVHVNDCLSQRLDELRQLLLEQRASAPDASRLPLVAAGLIAASSTARKVSRRSLLGLGWLKS